MSEPFASPPTELPALSDCSFYHTMDLPGYGLVEGEWDLRRTADVYLGHVNFAGKRVLDVGTTDGFLCFYAEQRGAYEVVGVDLSPAHAWDTVPFADETTMRESSQFQAGIARLNNSFWLSHRLLGSKAKLVYADVYSIPRAVGEFDIAIFGAILLHLRDPFLALQRVLSLVKETVIVVDLLWPRKSLLYLASGILRRPIVEFLPNPVTKQPRETWWAIPPSTVKRWLAILGFEAQRTLYHRQRHRQRWHWLYTVVAHRARYAQ